MKSPHEMPSSPEAEQGVLGCLLWDAKTTMSDVVTKFIGVRDPWMDLRHETIFKAMEEIVDESRPVDLITVSQKLKDKGMLDQVGGLTYLSSLQDAVPSAANLSFYLDIVVDNAVLRYGIRLCSDLIAKAYDSKDAMQQWVDEAEKAVMTIRPSVRIEMTTKMLIQHAINKIEQKCNEPDALTGLPTGLPDLDKLCDGCHGGEMIVIAALPSCGKSALASQIAISNAINSGVPVAIFTAEMTPVSLMVRAICSNSKVNFKKVVSGDVPKMLPSAVRLSKAPIFIENVSGLSIGQVQAIARRLKQQHGIKLIVVDYIQLLTGTGDNREQQISSVSKGCKSMAMDLDAAVLALSQLTDDGRLRESRAIGQDADSIWKLENDGDWQPLIQPVNLRIEKCRDGETGLVPLTFFKTHTRFECPAKISDEDVPHRQHKN